MHVQSCCFANLNLLFLTVTAKKCKKSVMHVKSCCFANLNLLFLTVTAKKCTKKRDARAELLFCQSKSIAVLPFSLTTPSSLLKLPIVHQSSYFISPHHSLRFNFCSLRCSSIDQEMKSIFFIYQPYFVYFFFVVKNFAFFPWSVGNKPLY